MNLETLKRAIQTEVGAQPDGAFGPDTLSRIYEAVTGRPWVETTAAIVHGAVVVQSAPVANNWPKEADAAAFYGTRPNLTQISLPYPMRMEYDGAWHAITSITCHTKVAASLRRILDAILAHYGTPEAIKAVGMDVYDGCYNDRNVRGSTTKRSMHAYGAAIDLDAEHNPLGATTGIMPAEVVAIFKAEGWRWGGDYKGRKDWMHFEACS